MMLDPQFEFQFPPPPYWHYNATSHRMLQNKVIAARKRDWIFTVQKPQDIDFKRIDREVRETGATDYRVVIFQRKCKAQDGRFQQKLKPLDCNNFKCVVGQDQLYLGTLDWTKEQLYIFSTDYEQRLQGGIALTDTKISILVIIDDFSQPPSKSPT
jgi:hypothetical protein